MEVTIENPALNLSDEAAEQLSKSIQEGLKLLGTPHPEAMAQDYERRAADKMVVAGLLYSRASDAWADREIGLWIRSMVRASLNVMLAAMYIRQAQNYRALLGEGES